MRSTTRCASAWTSARNRSNRCAANWASMRTGTHPDPPWRPAPRRCSRPRLTARLRRLPHRHVRLLNRWLPAGRCRRFRRLRLAGKRVCRRQPGRSLKHTPTRRGRPGSRAAPVFFRLTIRTRRSDLTRRRRVGKPRAPRRRRMVRQPVLPLMPRLVRRCISSPSIRRRLRWRRKATHASVRRVACSEPSWRAHWSWPVWPSGSSVKPRPNHHPPT